MEVRAEVAVSRLLQMVEHGTLTLKCTVVRQFDGVSVQE